jgi:hypothetical protein
MPGGPAEIEELVFIIHDSVMIKRACANADIVLGNWKCSVTHPQNFHYDPRISADADLEYAAAVLSPFRNSTAKYLRLAGLLRRSHSGPRRPGTSGVKVCERASVCL